MGVKRLIEIMFFLGETIWIFLKEDRDRRGNVLCFFYFPISLQFHRNTRNCYYLGNSGYAINYIRQQWKSYVFQLGVPLM